MGLLRCHYNVRPLPPDQDPPASKPDPSPPGCGKVRHEHVAKLGTVDAPSSIPERFVFWQRLHERMAVVKKLEDPARASAGHATRAPSGSRMLASIHSLSRSRGGGISGATHGGEGR